MDGIINFFDSIGYWFNSLTLDGVLTGVQNFLYGFGRIAQAFFDALP